MTKPLLGKTSAAARWRASRLGRSRSSVRDAARSTSSASSSMTAKLDHSSSKERTAIAPAVRPTARTVST
jgi:hypothetical protein